MKFTTVLLSVAAAACALFATETSAQDLPLPWDGRGQDLTVATLETKYKLHIFKQRQNQAKADPANYITIAPKGRSPAFNGDTGVISIGVDNDAIFGGQTNFRRSELVQNIAGNTAGTTFFRASVKKEAAWLNAHSWQIIFPESHSFEVRIDATTTPPKIIFYTGGSLDVKWSADFELSTWYNFGIAVSSGKIDLYTSTGNGALALTKSVANTGSAASSYEFHYGMLTLSNDGSAPKMVAGKQDILDYNGVSVEKTVSAGGSSTASDATTAPAAATTTAKPAATTAKPAATTAKPATSAPSAAADADGSDNGDDEYATPAPATTTAAPATTTTAPAATSTSPTVSPSTTTKTPKSTKKTPKPGKACKKKSA
ncbi:hypothetical protein Gpo141_00012959 [Globisporangium polare]